jgi:hypothetical protein
MTQAVLVEQGRPVARKSNRGGHRPGAGRPKSGRDDIAVKVDRVVVARAQFVARLRGLTLAEYLSEAARPTVDRDFARETKRQEDEPGS